MAICSLKETTIRCTCGMSTALPVENWPPSVGAGGQVDGLDV